jgi:hypothetical protein
VGRDSSVGIATVYRLDCPGIESRWGVKFSALVQAGPVYHPESYKRGYQDFLEGKRSEHGVVHPHPSSAEVKERIELYLLLLHWTFVACSRVTFTFTFTCYSVCCVTAGSTFYKKVPAASCDITSDVCSGYVQVSGAMEIVGGKFYAFVRKTPKLSSLESFRFRIMNGA